MPEPVDVIGARPGARIFVHRQPVDMRLHYNGLWGLVGAALGHDVLEGDVFVFLGRTRTRAKLLWWDGTGLLVLCKRLDQGRFVAPWTQPGDGPLVLSSSELGLLLEGCLLIGKVPLSPAPWVPGQP